MGTITNLPRSARLFEDLFQFRYFSSRQEHFSSRFLLFLARKFAPAKLFSRLSLSQSGIISPTFFQNCAPCWTKLSKQFFYDVSRASIL